MSKSNKALIPLEFCAERIATVKKHKKAKEFSNLFFSGTNKISEAAAFDLPQRTRIKMLRISLLDEEPLHLAGIELFQRDSNGELTPVAIECQLVLSSAAGSNLEHRETNKIYTPHMFHTEKGEHEKPWVVIKFEQPVQVDHIRLFNCREHTERIGMLVFEMSPSGLKWKTLFEHSALFASFLNTVNDAGNTKITPDSVAIGEDERNLVNLIVIAACYGLSNLADYMILLEKDFDCTQFKRMLSREVLYEQELEFSVHGPHRTFRFWPVEKKKEYLRESVHLIDILLGITENVCFAYGTALGFVREVDHFIPHDDDIDILIGLPEFSVGTFARGLHLIGAYLKDRGITVGRQHECHLHVYLPSGYLVDLFLGLYNAEGRLVSLPVWRHLRIEDIFPPITIDILGELCLTPRNPIRYLEATYGKDWRIPMLKECHAHP